MMPRPMKATVVIEISFESNRWWSDAGGRRAGGRREPGETLDGADGRLVLQGDVPVVALGRQRGEMPVDVQLPGARFAATGAVGDLHVADPVEVVLDARSDIVAVDVQVVQVAQELHVVHAGSALNPVDHPDH